MQCDISTKEDIRGEEGNLSGGEEGGEEEGGKEAWEQRAEVALIPVLTSQAVRSAEMEWN